MSILAKYFFVRFVGVKFVLFDTLVGFVVAHVNCTRECGGV
jgi:hypothetical protein